MRGFVIVEDHARGKIQLHAKEDTIFSRFEQNTNVAFLFCPQVEDPRGNRQYFKQAISSEDYSFNAHSDGQYTYCFSNEGWASNSKEVSFNVHGIVYVPESELAQDPLETEGEGCPYTDGVCASTLRTKLTVSSLVRRLSEALAQVKDEQSYIVMRERVHRNTAESTNARVKWWSMFQLAVLIGEGVFQVWWLKRFFEVCSSRNSVVNSDCSLTLLRHRSSALSDNVHTPAFKSGVSPVWLAMGFRSSIEESLGL